MNVATGSIVADRYVLFDRLGSGGMADVYRATDQALGREVAVKMLRSTTAGPTERARFAAEARTVAALNHPGLVTLLDAGVEDEQPYLIMELIDGPTLGQRVSEDGPLDSEQLRVVGGQLAEGLTYAHERGIVHRDVKPGNILLRRDGRVVLTDFGIARLVADSAQHTNTGDVIGSPAYLAPEQVNGSPLSTAVDVYSLGLVLIEAFTGVRSYPGPPVEAAIARLQAPPAIPMSMDRGLRDLLVQMTALDPDLRPPAREVAARMTPGAVLGAETAVLELGSLTSTMDIPAEVGAVAPAARRIGPRVLLGALAAMIAAGLGVFGLTQLHQDPVAATPRTPTNTAAPSITAHPTTKPSSVIARTTRPPVVSKKAPPAPHQPGHQKKPHGKGRK